MLKILLLFLNFSLINTQEEEYAVCEMKLINYHKFEPVSVNWCGHTCTTNCSPVLLTTRTKHCFKLNMKRHSFLNLTSTIKVQHQICGCNLNFQECNKKQKYDSKSCSCKCIDQTLKDSCLGDTKIWNSNICECMTKKKICTTTTAWNATTNRCELIP